MIHHPENQVVCDQLAEEDPNADHCCCRCRDKDICVLQSDKCCNETED